DAVHTRIRLEDRGEQHAMTTSDIDDGLEAREVVRLGHRRADARRNAGHALVKDGRLVGVPAEIVEDGFAKNAVKGRGTGLDRLKQIAAGPPVPLGATEVGDAAE